MAGGASGRNWSVAFGMVVIGLKLFPGARDEVTSFKGIHTKCWENGQDPTFAQEFRCRGCGEIPPTEERAKGVEISKGQYVLVTEDEIKASRPEPEESLTVVSIVPWGQIDPIMLSKSYFVGPQEPPKGSKPSAAHRAFALLRGYLTQSNKAALLTYVDKGHDKIAILKPYYPDGPMILFEMYFQNEIRPGVEQFKPGTFPAIEITDGEMALGETLFAAFSKDLDISPYRDSFPVRVADLVEAKQTGQALPVATKNVQKPTDDLMEALRKSLGMAATVTATGAVNTPAEIAGPPPTDAISGPTEKLATVVAKANAKAKKK